MTRLAFALAAIVVGTGLSGQAAAVTVNRDYLSHGTAGCQAALPVFDGNIRKRPKAIANEGTSTAFITCDFDSINNGGSGSSVVEVYMINRSGADVMVNCTLVDGIFDTTFVAVPKSVLIPATLAATPVSWSTADNGGNNFAAPATSCALPPGVEIGAVRQVYPEEVGS